MMNIQSMDSVSPMNSIISNDAIHINTLELE